MTLTLSSRRDKAPILDLLRKVLIEFLFPGTTPTQREAILTHLAWIERHKDTMFVSCNLETVPELLLTKITLSVSFTPTKKETVQ